MISRVRVPEDLKKHWDPNNCTIEKSTETERGKPLFCVVDHGIQFTIAVGTEDECREFLDSVSVPPQPTTKLFVFILSQTDTLGVFSSLEKAKFYAHRTFGLLLQDWVEEDTEDTWTCKAESGEDEDEEDDEDVAYDEPFVIAKHEILYGASEWFQGK